MKISPLHLKSLVHTLEIEGFDSRELSRRCALAGQAGIADADEWDDWVPIERFDDMMAIAIELTGDPSFGLVAGKSLALMRFGLLTPLALFTPSLRQMIHDITAFSPLVVERCEFELLEAPGSAQLVVDPLVQGGRSGRFRMEFVATNMLQMLRFSHATAEHVYEVNLPYACPAGMEERYASVLGNAVRFGQPGCSIVFDPQLLDRPLPTHDEVSYLSARGRVESAIAALRARCDTAEKVRSLLLGRLAQPPSVDETASSLGTSARTLRRQLALLGTTHRAVLRECQQLATERLLAEDRLSLKQIAQQVGFTSASSLHRAFRDWTGTTPLAWRHRRQARLPRA